MLLTLLLSGPPTLWGHQAHAEVDPACLRQVGAVLVHEAVVLPLTCLLRAAEAEGVALTVTSGYRSREAQRLLFERGAHRKGMSLQAYAWWTAPPGYSEHHTGLALDFAIPELPLAQGSPATFFRTPGGRWLWERARDFGFECSFPRGGARVAFEPWHWRYVGTPEAQAHFLPVVRGQNLGLGKPRR